MFSTPIQILGAVLTILVSVVVFTRPVPGARLVVVANLCAYLLSPAVQNWTDLVSPQWAILGVDSLLLGITTWVLFRHPGRWIQITWAAMGLTVLAHFAKTLDPALLIRGYIGTLYLFYFIFLAGLLLSVFPLGSDRRATADRPMGRSP